MSRLISKLCSAVSTANMYVINKFSSVAGCKRCKIILTYCTFDFDFFSHQTVTTAKRIIRLFNFSNCARQDYDICIFRLRDWAFKLAREDSASRIQFFSSRSSVTESANLNPEWILNKTFEFEYLRLNHPFGDNANFGFQSDQLTRKIVHFFFKHISDSCTSTAVSYFFYRWFLYR